MYELEKIYSEYACKQNYELGYDIEKYFKTVPHHFKDEAYIKNHLSLYLLKAIKVWKALPGRKHASKCVNKNVNYVLIPEDNSIEVHILIHRGEIVRIKAWNLYKKESSSVL